MSNSALFRSRTRLHLRAGLLAGLLTIFMDGTVKAAERTGLSTDERKELADVPRFNDTRGRGGWQLRNRNVPEMSLAGIRLEGATVENVEFERTDLSNANVRKSTFQEVDFPGAKLAGARFEDVQFIKCKFVGVSADGAGFKNCVFRECAGTNLKWKSNAFEGVVFERLIGKGVGLAQAALLRTRFEESTLNDCDFTSASLDRVQFDRCGLLTAGFSHINSRDLTFSGGEIKNSSFDEAVCTNIVFEGCSASGLSFKSCKGLGYHMTNCPNLERVGFLDSELHDLSIVQCKSAPELLILNTQVTNLTLADLDLSHFELTESSVSGASVLRKCRIRGSDLSESKFHGLLMDDTTFEGQISVNQANFTGVRLKGVKYGAGFKLHATGLVSTDSDKFGP